MFKAMTLKTKLLLFFLAMSIVPFSAISMISLLKSDKALSDMAFAQLESMREVKKSQIQNFFTQHRENMTVLIDTIANFKENAFDTLRGIQETKKKQMEAYFHERLTDAAILSKNPMIADALNAFASAFNEAGNMDKDLYTFFEDVKYGGGIRQFKQGYGYDDILLISKAGSIVYTVGKGSDLGQNLITGSLKDSSLGRCFQKALTEVNMQDFEMYPPSENRHVSFIGTPIIQNEQMVGALIFRLSSDAINSIVRSREGLGKTGETYLVGKHNGTITYRSDRVVKQGKFGEVKSDRFTEAALSGKSGTDVRIGEAGIATIVCYAPLNISGMNWAILTTINIEEVIVPRLDGEEEDYFKKYIKNREYSDLLLIHPHGDVIYSVARQADYHTNLLNGQYADSGLGRVFKKVSESKTFVFADFGPYAPAGGEPSAFIAQPVIFHDKIEAVVALRLPIQFINKVMLERSGMGKTGETYLVGSDKLMRSDSFRNSKRYSVKDSFADPEKSRIDTRASREALSEKTGCGIIMNYNGNQVLSAYTPLKIYDTATWALIAEMDQTEAIAALKNLKWLMMTLAATMLIIITVLSLQLAGYIVRPVRLVISGLIESAEKVSSVSAQIAASGQSLSSASSEQAGSVQETTSSLEQMSSMTQQNAHHARQADMLMSEGRQAVDRANQTMNNLTSAMSDISAFSRETSKIVKTIDEIAFQTNLLALNAAVEAARAGESGAGFAVVADEVRNLAMRSTEAAKTTAALIEQTVRRIQDVSELADVTDSSFKEVKTNSAKAGELVSEIAEASAEQALGIEQISKAVSAIGETVQQNASTAEEVASSSEDMRSQANCLTHFVNELLSLVEGRFEKGE